MNPVLMDVLPFVRQGFCCSQLLMLLMLQARVPFRASVMASATPRGTVASCPAAPVCWLCSAARGRTKRFPTRC